MGTDETLDLLPDYERIAPLGQGAFGKVWLVQDKALGVQQALKIIQPAGAYDKTELYREPQALQELQHDRIVRVTAAGAVDGGGVYVVMEYMPEGSVADMSDGEPVPLRQALDLGCDVCWALEYAHNKGYVHNDVKPANILLSQSGRGKLSDFGLTRPIGPLSAGYLMHMAPESISGGMGDSQTDIYALGVTLYRMVNGDSYLPIVTDADELQRMITEGRFPDRSKYRPFVPRSTKVIINKAMNTERSRRYSAASELRAAIERTRIYCDWREEAVPTGTRWTAMVGSRSYEATLTRGARGYSFAVVRQSAGKRQMRIVRDCISGAKRQTALKHLRQVLSRIAATGG